MGWLIISVNILQTIVLYILNDWTQQNVNCISNLLWKAKFSIKKRIGFYMSCWRQNISRVPIKAVWKNTDTEEGCLIIFSIFWLLTIACLKNGICIITERSTGDWFKIYLKSRNSLKISRWMVCYSKEARIKSYNKDFPSRRSNK